MNRENSRILQSGREPTTEHKSRVLRHTGEDYRLLYGTENRSVLMVVLTLIG